MKFHLSVATIATNFLFILLWMILFINASYDKNTNDLGNVIMITQNLQLIDTGSSQLHMEDNNTMRLLHSINAHIFSTIFKEFITIHEILILRKTCTDFQILLFPNEKNMVLFCKDFGSKEMDKIPLLWFDLKFFVNQSYVNALENMEMLTLKRNQYAVAIRGCRDENLISWYNEHASNLYSKTILNKFQNKLENTIFPRIYNKWDGTAWAKITNEGN